MTRTPIQMVLAGALMLASCVVVAAQEGKPVRLRGTIESVEGHKLTVKTADGEHTLMLGDKAMVVAVVKASMADVKQGTFLGSAAMPQPDGSQKALEVHIFPEQMRGTGEGHRPYAPVPNSTMTNGTASGATVSSVDGSTMTVKYREGEKKIVVPPGTPIMRYEIGGQGDLTAGAHFTVLAATRKPDGTFEAGRINVGRNGVVPM